MNLKGVHPTQVTPYYSSFFFTKHGSDVASIYSMLTDQLSYADVQNLSIRKEKYDLSHALFKIT